MLLSIEAVNASGLVLLSLGELVPSNGIEPPNWNFPIIPITGSGFLSS